MFPAKQCNLYLIFPPKSFLKTRLNRLYSFMGLILFQFSSIVKLNKRFTRPIDKIRLKQKQNRLPLCHFNSGIGLTENKRISWLLSFSMTQYCIFQVTKGQGPAELGRGGEGLWGCNPLLHSPLFKNLLVF